MRQRLACLPGYHLPDTATQIIFRPTNPREARGSSQLHISVLQGCPWVTQAPTVGVLVYRHLKEVCRLGIHFAYVVSYKHLLVSVPPLSCSSSLPFPSFRQRHGTDSCRLHLPLDNSRCPGFISKHGVEEALDNHLGRGSGRRTADQIHRQRTARHRRQCCSS